MHIDTDELLYPSGKHGFSIQEVCMHAVLCLQRAAAVPVCVPDRSRCAWQALASIPEDVDNLVMPNYEAAPETHTVVDPFREVRRACPKPAPAATSPLPSLGTDGATYCLAHGGGSGDAV